MASWWSILIGAAITAAAPAVFAQGYPSRAVTMIVPYAPGGTGEILGRALAAQMAHVLG